MPNSIFRKSENLQGRLSKRTCFQVYYFSCSKKDPTIWLDGDQRYICKYIKIKNTNHSSMIYVLATKLFSDGKCRIVLLGNGTEHIRY